MSNELKQEIINRNALSLAKVPQGKLLLIFQMENMQSRLFTAFIYDKSTD